MNKINEENRQSVEKNTNLHYELPSTGRFQCLVVQTQETCKIQNASYEPLQVMHCTMDL